MLNLSRLRRWPELQIILSSFKVVVAFFKSLSLSLHIDDLLPPFLRVAG